MGELNYALFGGPMCAGPGRANNRYPADDGCGATFAPISTTIYAFSPAIGVYSNTTGVLGMSASASVGAVYRSQGGNGAGPYRSVGSLSSGFRAPQGIFMIQGANLTGGARNAVSGTSSSAGTPTATFWVNFTLPIQPVQRGTPWQNLTRAHANGSVHCTAPCSKAPTVSLSTSYRAVPFSVTVGTGSYYLWAALVTSRVATESASGTGGPRPAWDWAGSGSRRTHRCAGHSSRGVNPPNSSTSKCSDAPPSLRPSGTGSLSQRRVDWTPRRPRTANGRSR
jgi:hypothetical protein